MTQLRFEAPRRRSYHRWTDSERERLLRLMELHPVAEVASILRFSEHSVRAMLKRLGASATMGKDWFTKYTLAQALRVRPERVQQWIDRRWLETRTIETCRSKRVIIRADDFCCFCKEHRTDVIGNRLSSERLDFVMNFVFPASHTELLPVRESKRERDAYNRQLPRVSDKFVRTQREPDTEESETDLRP